MEITPSEAKELMDAYVNDTSKLNTTSVYLTREELDRIIDKDCVGIRIYLGQKTYKDASGDYVGIQLVSARVTASDPKGMGYLEKNSLPPCPKTCPM